MSPRRAVSDTRDTRAAAAEMPRDVDQLNGVEVDRLTQALAIARRHVVAAVERAVDLLQRGDELLAPVGVPPLVGASGAVVVLQADEIGEQLLATGDQSFPLRRARVLVAGGTPGRPDADAGDAQGERQRDRARRLAVVRESAHRQRDRLAGGNGSAHPGDVGLPFRGHLLLIRNLRRTERRAADLPDDHGQLLDGRRKRLRDSRPSRRPAASRTPPARTSSPAETVRPR